MRNIKKEVKMQNNVGFFYLKFSEHIHICVRKYIYV